MYAHTYIYIYVYMTQARDLKLDFGLLSYMMIIHCRGGVKDEKWTTWAELEWTGLAVLDWTRLDWTRLD